MSWSKVKSKKRKPCARCFAMIEIGDRAILSGDRNRPGGVWLLWHPECHAQHRKELLESLHRAEHTRTDAERKANASRLAPRGIAPDETVEQREASVTSGGN